MVARCCIPQCREQNKGLKGISMFEIPAKPPEVRAAWIKNICIATGASHINPPSWIFKDYTRLCMRHFEDSAINDDGAKKRVRSGAVPTVFEHIGDIVMPKKKTYKIKKVSLQQNVSTQGLLYEPDTILQEPITGSQDIGVQVDVTDKTSQTAQVTRLKNLLKMEKTRSRELELKLRSKNRATAKTLLHKKLFAIVEASERGDENARILLQQIKQFEVEHVTPMLWS